MADAVGAKPGPTPGPWQARFLYRMIQAARKHSELIIQSNPESDWDDACLMSASPDLLAACEAYLAALADPFGVERIREIQEAMRAAVAKARGEA